MSSVEARSRPVNWISVAPIRSSASRNSPRDPRNARSAASDCQPCTTTYLERGAIGPLADVEQGAWIVDRLKDVGFTTGRWLTGARFQLLTCRGERDVFLAHRHMPTAHDRGDHRPPPVPSGHHDERPPREWHLAS